ncbi:vanin-like protein 1 isoform X2 [Rhodnius prolixus]
MKRFARNPKLIGPFLLLLLYSVLQTIQANGDAVDLIGAVVNYKPIWDTNKPLHDNIIVNAERYCDLIKKAATSAADIIVFPAEGLHGAHINFDQSATIPVLEGQLNQSNYEAVNVVSRCARNASLYVVMTAEQLVHNRTCLIQLVLDRKGATIARNLEAGCRQDGERSDEIFTTDNGYRLGLLLNEDIYLEERNNKLKAQEVSHFVLSYDLPGSLPFSSGIQTEWWWSYGQESLLLAAGLGEHLRSGSGIYMARLAETISRVSQGHFPVNLLIVRSLPSMQQVFTTGDSQERLENGNRKLRRSFGSSASAYAEACTSIDKREIREKVDYNLDNYTRSILTVNDLDQPDWDTVIMDETRCNGALCCRFKLTWQVRMADTETTTGGCYLVVVGNQHETLGSRGSGQVQRCALVHITTPNYCTNHSSAAIFHSRMLDNSNAILKHLEVLANQPWLTPNILLDKTIEPIVRADNLMFWDTPFSRMYVTRTIRKFVTLGLQRIQNYTLDFI